MKNFIFVRFWRLKQVKFFVLVLVITCLAGQFGINCPSLILKVLKLPKWNKDNFKIFKNRDGDLSPKLSEPNMKLPVNHTLCIETNIF